METHTPKNGGRTWRATCECVLPLGLLGPKTGTYKPKSGGMKIWRTTCECDLLLSLLGPKMGSYMLKSGMKIERTTFKSGLVLGILGHKTGLYMPKMVQVAKSILMAENWCISSPFFHALLLFLSSFFFGYCVRLHLVICWPNCLLTYCSVKNIP